MRRFEKTFEKYDILVSHTPDTHIIGLHNHQKSGKPYITTWHGSDINVLPYEDRKILPLLKNYIENASVNYFVSKYLLEKSNYITPKGNKAVYYTGPSESFRRFSEDERASIRARHNCSDKKVVAFVGSITQLKMLRFFQVFLAEQSKHIQKISNFGLLETGIRKMNS